MTKWRNRTQKVHEVHHEAQDFMDILAVKNTESRKRPPEVHEVHQKQDIHGLHEPHGLFHDAPM
jgi:hypothetical protein